MRQLQGTRVLASTDLATLQLDLSPQHDTDQGDRHVAIHTHPPAASFCLALPRR